MRIARLLNRRLYQLALAGVAPEAISRRSDTKARRAPIGRRLHDRLPGALATKRSPGHAASTECRPVTSMRGRPARGKTGKQRSQ